MKLYIIVRQSMWTGFISSSKCSLPYEAALREQIKNYAEITAFDNKDKALEMAKIFDVEGCPPITSGSYGVVAQITVELETIPTLQDVTCAQIYDSWVDSQNINYCKYDQMEAFKEEKTNETNTTFKAYQLPPQSITSIDSLFFTEAAKARNSHLVDSEMPHGFSCTIS